MVGISVCESVFWKRKWKRKTQIERYFGAVMLKLLCVHISNEIVQAGGGLVVEVYWCSRITPRGSVLRASEWMMKEFLLYPGLSSRVCNS